MTELWILYIKDFILLQVVEQCTEHRQSGTLRDIDKKNQIEMKQINKEKGKQMRTGRDRSIYC